MEPRPLIQKSAVASGHDMTCVRANQMLHLQIAPIAWRQKPLLSPVVDRSKGFISFCFETWVTHKRLLLEREKRERER